MAFRSNSSRTIEGPTFDLENLNYGERNEINDLEMEEDDVVEVTGSNPSPSNTKRVRKMKSDVWIFFYIK